jgi:hypothetical protein
MTVLQNIIEAPIGVKGEAPEGAVAYAQKLLAKVLATMKELSAEGLTMVGRHARDQFRPGVGRPRRLMDGGAIVEQGTPEDVIDNPSRSAREHSCPGSSRLALDSAANPRLWRLPESSVTTPSHVFLYSPSPRRYRRKIVKASLSRLRW